MFTVEFWILANPHSFKNMHTSLKMYMYSLKSLISDAEGSTMTLNLAWSKPVKFLLVIMINYNWLKGFVFQHSLD